MLRLLSRSGAGGQALSPLRRAGQAVLLGGHSQRDRFAFLLSFTSSASDPNEEVDFGFREVPKKKKQELVEQVFTNVAGSYDVMNDLMSVGMHRLWKDRFVEKLRPFPGMQHLDVAGGTGDIAFRVLQAARHAELLTRSPETAHITVTDINPSMLQEGEKRRKSMGIPESAMTFVVGNAEQLPFDDSSADAYTIAFGIRNVTDKMAALKDARRILKPGGRLLVLEFSQVTVPGLREFYESYSFNVIPALGHFVANDRDSYQYLVESIRMFPSQADFADMIRAAGFKSVDYENLSGGIVAIHSGFKI